MRKIFQLLSQYKDFILYVILLVICFNMIAKRNSIQSVDIINSSNSIVGFFYNTKANIVNYFHLKSVNDSLLNENARLRHDRDEQFYIDTFQDVLADIAIMAIDSSKIKQMNSDTSLVIDSTFRKIDVRKIVKYETHHYIPARVINNSIADERMNFITINRGRSDGIKEKMAVVTGNGIVGRVVNVSENFATVLSLLSVGRTYNVKLADGTIGSITWDEGSANSVTLYRIPKVADVQLGDSVFTTEHSIFPDNILVGTVANIVLDKKSNSLNVKILLSTNFRKLKYVYVVKKDFAEEREELEKNTKENIKDK